MKNGELAVLALGGNAILQAGQKGTAQEQLANVEKTCVQFAELASRGHRFVITHGNGPQVGNIIIQNETTTAVPAMPMDICGAESQGMIGYMMQRSLLNEFAARGIKGRTVVAVVTQVAVRADDPAFANPTKPVGPFQNEDYARRRSAETGEKWIEDAGRGWRRVVPSPDPQEVVELPAVRTLVEAGHVVICSGGGGIPVVNGSDGIRGVEAVIDKDLAGQRLATGLGADIFAILTDVPGVALDWGKPTRRFVSRMTVAEARVYQAEGHFRAGSMGPKVEACLRFVEAGGKRAVITSLTEVVGALAGQVGTHIVA